MPKNVPLSPPKQLRCASINAVVSKRWEMLRRAQQGVLKDNFTDSEYLTNPITFSCKSRHL